MKIKLIMEYYEKEETTQQQKNNNRVQRLLDAQLNKILYLKYRDDLKHLYNDVLSTSDFIQGIIETLDDKKRRTYYTRANKRYLQAFIKAYKKAI